MTEPPGWFKRALAEEPRQSTHEVEGTSINVLEWGDVGSPGLVLVHGGAAHARWWSHLAPMFSQQYHVTALDLSGHGDSGRRRRYSHEVWSREIVSVCETVGFDRPPVIVGHSLGGLVAIQTAATFGELLAGAVIVDSPVRRPDPESEEGTRGRAFRSPGVYPDLKSALTHFHLIPPQPEADPWIIDHVARHSLHETDEGWTWKFDANLFTHTMVPMNEQLASVKCRVAMLRGEHSVVVPQDTAEYMYELMGRVSPVVTIPEAHHHLILDQPLSFVTALRTLLADWQHSVPFERK
ncbi:MAG: alpha/beta hydrolase [Acidobacteria bacterium]|nr:alpha/beta hydrolase [Acidobacteriota bacterium]